MMMVQLLGIILMGTIITQSQVRNKYFENSAV